MEEVGFPSVLSHGLVSEWSRKATARRLLTTERITKHKRCSFGSDAGDGVIVLVPGPFVWRY